MCFDFLLRCLLRRGKGLNYRVQRSIFPQVGCLLQIIMHIYTHTHIHIYIHIHTYIHIYININTYINTHTYIHTHKPHGNQQHWLNNNQPQLIKSVSVWAISDQESNSDHSIIKYAIRPGIGQSKTDNIQNRRYITKESLAKFQGNVLQIVIEQLGKNHYTWGRRPGRDTKLTNNRRTRHRKTNRWVQWGPETGLK